MSAIAEAVADVRDPVSRSEVILARQAILDTALAVHGYELLHRSVGKTAACFADADAASAEVITTGFTDIGMSRLVDRGLAYINVTRDFLLSRDPMALPAERVALEFPGDTDPDREFLDALAEYRADGYRLVMDGGRVTRDNLALLKHAHAVKLDVHELGIEEAARQAELVRPLGRDVMAARVETTQELAALQPLGVMYFQGFFFARPQVVSGTRVGSSKLTMLRLLAALYDPDVEVGDVAGLVGQDPGLSFKLMRFINSAFLSLPGKVDSIQRAVMFMGLAGIKRWASVMVVASVDDKPGELTRTLLVRARLCERLCAEARAADPGAAFIVGLFSGLDALLDRELPELVQEMPLAGEVVRALLGREGALGEALACTLGYERGDWDEVAFAGMPPRSIGALYEESVVWACEAAGGL